MSKRLFIVVGEKRLTGGGSHDDPVDQITPICNLVWAESRNEAYEIVEEEHSQPINHYIYSLEISLTVGETLGSPDEAES